MRALLCLGPGACAKGSGKDEARADRRPASRVRREGEASDVGWAIVTQLRASTTRKLAMALEPVAGQVYFSPECHANYAALGFSPSPGSLPNGVQFPDGAAYFTSRGSVMGHVPCELVAAAFAVFNPEAVVPAVRFGWSKVDAATICAARTTGAVDQLVRILGPEPEGLAEVTGST